MGYLENNCSFYEMTPELVARCKEFRCSLDSGIDEFYHKEYDAYAREQLGRSYCFVEDNSRSIVCAFTLCNSAVTVRNLPNQRRKRIQRCIPHSKHRGQYPAVLVGQLAVFDGFSHLGIGEEAMNFIKAMSLPKQFDAEWNHIMAGCRFVLVDAKDYDKVLAYYESNEFDYVYGSADEENRNLGMKTNDHKTRLMFFDLIRIAR